MTLALKRSSLLHTATRGLQQFALPQITIAFAGSINSPAYGRALSTLAEALQNSEASLLIFGPVGSAQAEKLGLTRANVKLEGLVTSAELIGRLRNEADALFVPMSHDF